MLTNINGRQRSESSRKNAALGGSFICRGNLQEDIFLSGIRPEKLGGKAIRVPGWRGTDCHPSLLP